MTLAYRNIHNASHFRRDPRVDKLDVHCLNKINTEGEDRRNYEELSLGKRKSYYQLDGVTEEWSDVNLKLNLYLSWNLSKMLIRSSVRVS